MVDVQILGPLVVHVDEQPVEIESPKERAVIEALALEPGRMIDASRLVDALWGSDAPPSATKTLQSHISRVRAALPPGSIETGATGYRLVIDPEDVDAHQFQVLVTTAGRRAEGNRWDAVIDLAEEAELLWRTTPLTDLGDGEVRAAASAHLAALHQRAVELRAAASLARGEHQQLIPDLQQLVEEFPYDEQLWADLMLALHRAGRRAEALATYGRLRERLRDDLGVAPSSALRELESAILREDPALEAPPVPPPDRLPSPSTSFVGRSAEVAQTVELLRSRRLVTLTGPGGVGKTRLAIEAARRALRDGPERWRDGATMVELADARSEADVIASLTSLLPMPAAEGGLPSATRVRDHLARSSMLLVLDAAEGAAAPIGRLAGELVHAAPELTVLVTSRVTVPAPGAARVVVTPLPVEPVAHDQVSDAVRLLLDRAARPVGSGIDPSVEEHRRLATELCRRVDGLPLGIELVAGRLAALPLTEVVSALRDHPRDVLALGRVTDGEEPTTLGTVLDATMELLDPGARDLLGCLSVFPGSFDLAAVRTVGGSDSGTAVRQQRPAGTDQRPTNGPDGGDRALLPPSGRSTVDELVELVDASLVTPVERSGYELRYQLADTTRAYAGRLLDEPHRSRARRAHAAHYAALARRIVAELSGERGWAWTRRIEREMANLRAALRWYVDNDIEGALAFTGLVALHAALSDDLDDAQALAETLIEFTADDPSTSPIDRGWTLMAVGWPRLLTGDVDGGIAAMEEAAGLFVRAGDSLGAALAFTSWGHMELLTIGDVDRAMAFYDRAMAETAGVASPPVRATVQIEAAHALILADRVDDRIPAMLDAAETALTRTRSHERLGHLAMDRMLAAYAVDDLDESERQAELAIRESRRARSHIFEQIGYVGLGAGRIHRGDLRGGHGLLVEAIRIASANHNVLQTGIALQAMACQRALAGRHREAARIRGAALAVSPEWPLFRRRYGELLAEARAALGDEFEREAERGAATPLGIVVDEVVSDRA